MILGFVLFLMEKIRNGLNLVKYFCQPNDDLDLPNIGIKKIEKPNKPAFESSIISNFEV